MILKNNASRPISVGTGSADTSVYSLVPGVNTIEQKEWDRLKVHPVIKQMLAHKEANGTLTLEVVKDDESAATGSAPAADISKELKDLSSKEAKEVIDGSIDLEQLKSWVESETRAPVKKAIEARIVEVEKQIAEATKDDAAE
jgi:hypothetical protein